MKLGKAKFILERWRSNVGIAQFFMTSYIAIKVGSPIIFWLFAGLLILSVIYTIFYDIKHIYPTESATGLKMNPEFQEMKEIIKRIEEKL